MHIVVDCFYSFFKKKYVNNYMLVKITRKINDFKNKFIQRFNHLLGR